MTPHLPLVPLYCILPPHILRHIAEHGNEGQKAWAWSTLLLSEQIRGQREGASMTILKAIASTPTGTLHRTIYDAHHAGKLPGKIVRSEGAPPSKDVSVNEAYDGAGAT